MKKLILTLLFSLLAFPALAQKSDFVSTLKFGDGSTSMTASTFATSNTYTVRGQVDYLTTPTIRGVAIKTGLTTVTLVDRATTATHAANADTATTATHAPGYGVLAGANVWTGTNDYLTTPTVNGVALGTSSGSGGGLTTVTLVDNANRLGGQLPSYYLNPNHVPVGTYSGILGSWDFLTTPTVNGILLGSGSGAGATALSALTDVSLTSQTTGQGVGWNGSTWTNMTLSGEKGETGAQGPAGGGTVLPSYMGNAGKVLTVDTSETTATWQATEKELPSYEGKANLWLMVNSDATGLEWANRSIGMINVENLGNVDITSPTAGQVLTYNGSNRWVNATGGGGGSTTVYATTGTLANGASFTVTHAADAYPNYKRTAQMFTRVLNETLLLHMDGANGATTLTDESSNKTPSVNSVTVSTAHYKFGTGSALFANTYSSVSYGGSQGITNFGTGDFTVDFWVYPTVINSMNVFVFQGPSYPYFEVFYYNGTLSFCGDTGGAVSIGAACTITANNWYHIAVTRSGTSMKVFLNGTSIATATNSTNFSDTTDAVCLGAGQDGSYFTSFIGYMDEVRIVKGTAKWTANFTPETSAYSLSYICTQVKNLSSSYVTIDYLSSTVTRFTNATGGAIDGLALVQILP